MHARLVSVQGQEKNIHLSLLLSLSLSLPPTISPSATPPLRSKAERPNACRELARKRSFCKSDSRPDFSLPRYRIRRTTLKPMLWWVPTVYEMKGQYNVYAKNICIIDTDITIEPFIKTKSEMICPKNGLQYELYSQEGIPYLIDLITPTRI